MPEYNNAGREVKTQNLPRPTLAQKAQIKITQAQNAIEEKKVEAAERESRLREVKRIAYEKAQAKQAEARLKAENERAERQAQAEAERDYKVKNAGYFIANAIRERVDNSTRKPSNAGIYRTRKIVKYKTRKAFIKIKGNKYKQVTRRVKTVQTKRYRAAARTPTATRRPGVGIGGFSMFGQPSKQSGFSNAGMFSVGSGRTKQANGFSNAGMFAGFSGKKSRKRGFF